MEPDDLLHPCSPFPPDLPDGTARPFPAAWRTEAVFGLARGIAEDGAFERLPILADALEESGCTDVALLRHCREPMAHCAECWAVNLALDRLPEVEPEPTTPIPIPELPSPVAAAGDTTESGDSARGGRLMVVLVLLLTTGLARLPQTNRDPPPTLFVPPINFSPAPNTAAELLVQSIRARKEVSLRDRGSSWFGRRVKERQEPNAPNERNPLPNGER